MSYIIHKDIKCFYHMENSVTSEQMQNICRHKNKTSVQCKYTINSLRHRSVYLLLWLSLDHLSRNFTKHRQKETPLYFEMATRSQGDLVAENAIRTVISAMLALLKPDFK